MGSKRGRKTVDRDTQRDRVTQREKETDTERQRHGDIKKGDGLQQRESMMWVAKQRPRARVQSKRIHW